MTGPRDWDKELAEIDKLIAAGDKAPPHPVPAEAGQPQPPAKAAAAGRADVAVTAAQGPRPTRRRDLVGVWFKVTLGVAGAMALTIWPYGKSCGLLLDIYLVGVAAVIAAGAWGMRAAWVHRRGLAHVVALAVVLAGLWLATAEILPRVGYARAAATWTCSSP
jgi:hypothetical protein